MKRRLYPVVKHGARFALFVLMTGVLTVPLSLAVNLAASHGDFADGFKHFRLGLEGWTGVRLLMLVIPIAFSAFCCTFAARTIERQTAVPKLQADANAPLLAAGDHGDGTGAC